jgi:ribosome-binding ATPase YchF (GTP1/OBG family)
MRVALLGLPGSGKTTVFNAVVDKPVPLAPGALQTDTHVQVAKVRDERLDRLGALLKPKKLTAAGLEIWDPPGLPPGSGERDKERRIRRLAELREADAYVLVVRNFVSDSYAYEPGREQPDPAAELGWLVEELLTADFVVADGRIQRIRENLRRGVRTQDKDKLELAVLERCSALLEAGEGLASLDLDAADEKRIRGYQLFGLKPFVLLVNGPEPAAEGLREGMVLRPKARLDLDAQVEAEVQAMDPAERPAFLEEFGIDSPAAQRLAHAVYRAVGLISFFTVGGDEVRAWTLRDGRTAIDAASKVHTDLADGFVRAEVFDHQELLDAGSEKEVKARGLMRLEHKGYVVKDGEVVHIRSTK